MLQTVAMDTIRALSFPCCPFVNSSVYLGQTTLPHNSCLSHSRSLSKVCHIWHWFKMLNRLSQTVLKKTPPPLHTSPTGRQVSCKQLVGDRETRAAPSAGLRPFSPLELNGSMGVTQSGMTHPGIYTCIMTHPGIYRCITFKLGKKIPVASSHVYTLNSSPVAATQAR